MILVRDNGQMCNNIIQFAHAWAWAREHGIKAVSMRFAYKYRHFRICDTWPHNFATYFIGKCGASMGLIPVVNYSDFTDETRLANERMLLSHSRLCVLEGWFVRHCDLVEKHLDEYRRLFAFRPADVQRAEAFVRGLPGDTLIGVHIRRGDYAKFLNGRYFFTDDCYISHIRQTMALAPGRSHTVIICTNDPALDISAYRRQLPGANVILSRGNAVEDLYTLAQCSHVIGAPSSYSLVATLYGKARLAFITSADMQLSAADFHGFMHHLRHFDEYFIQ